MGLIENIKNRFFNEQVEKIEETESGQEETKVVYKEKEVGSAGTEINAGYIQDDYLEKLSGTKKFDIFHQMNLGDAVVKMSTAAVKNPIRSASWTFNPASDSEQDEYLKKFVENAFFNNPAKTWRGQLNEILTLVENGHAPFEISHKIVRHCKNFGTYIGIHKLGWRDPRTIERWNVNNSGDLISITQMSNGDTQRNVDIDAKFIYNFTLDKVSLS